MFHSRLDCLLYHRRLEVFIGGPEARSESH
jgi:hypothetical protein